MLPKLHIACLLLTAPALAGNSLALREDWDGRLDPWTPYGPGVVQQDCLVANPGCSLALLAPCCGGKTGIARNVTLALDRLARVEFDFLTWPMTGDSDAAISLTLDDATQVNLTIGAFLATGMRLSTSTGGRANLAPAIAPGAWYQATIHLDPVAGRIHADLHAPGATHVASSQPLSLPASASAISRIEFWTQYWGGHDPTQFHFDNLQVTLEETA